MFHFLPTTSDGWVAYDESILFDRSTNAPSANDIGENEQATSGLRGALASAIQKWWSPRRKKSNINNGNHGLMPT